MVLVVTIHSNKFNFSVNFSIVSNYTADYTYLNEYIAESIFKFLKGLGFFVMYVYIELIHAAPSGFRTRSLKSTAFCPLSWQLF